MLLHFMIILLVFSAINTIQADDIDDAAEWSVPQQEEGGGNNHQFHYLNVAQRPPIFENSTGSELGNKTATATAAIDSLETTTKNDLENMTSTTTFGPTTTTTPVAPTMFGPISQQMIRRNNEEPIVHGEDGEDE